MFSSAFFWQDVRHSFKEVLAERYISWCVWIHNFRDPRSLVLLIFLTVGIYATLNNLVILIMIAAPVIAEILKTMEHTGMKIYWRQYSRSRLKHSKKRAQAA